MKFKELFETQMLDAVIIMKRVTSVSNQCGKMLSTVHNENKENQFCKTALHFNRLNYEAIDSILLCLKAGHLSEASVLFRWLMEICHLYFYLWKNEEEYIKWLSGKQISPSTARIFLEEEGYATWQETYGKLCNVVHGNAKYVENCFEISRMKSITTRQVNALNETIRNLMFFSSKINIISANFLKDMIDVSQYNAIAEECNSLEEAIFAFSDEHNRREAK